MTLRIYNIYLKLLKTNDLTVNYNYLKLMTLRSYNRRP